MLNDPDNPSGKQECPKGGDLSGVHVEISEHSGGCGGGRGAHGAGRGGVLRGDLPDLLLEPSESLLDLRDLRGLAMNRRVQVDDLLRVVVRAVRKSENLIIIAK